MQNVKLRLDYFLSLGLKLVVGDEVDHHGGMVITRNSVVASYNSPGSADDIIFIASFTSRKNKGVQLQPCGDDVPVACSFGIFNIDPAPAKLIKWGVKESVTEWRPDIESLIKMQIEHDRKLALTAECEKMTEAALKQGDKRRIEFMSNHSELEVHAVTYQFETDKEICCIAEDGLILTVDKEMFVAWHGAVDEIEVAKKKQIDLFCLIVNDNGKFISKNQLRFMQDAGMLAEILLPLKN